MKSSRLIKFLAVPILALMLFVLGIGAAGAQGDGPDVDPTFIAGNPSCASLGPAYKFGFKINNSPNGTFTLTNPPGDLTGGAPSDPTNSVTISGSDGNTFNWSSTLGIDAVIVKGGPNADAYVYDPPAESFGDDGLHAPTNPENGKYYGISHIEFCYDYELTANKTANATYTRTYDWMIDKQVDDNSHAGFTGDSFTSNYDVIVDQTVTDSKIAVSGTITVNNTTPFSVSFSVSDSVAGSPAVVNCPTNTLAPNTSTTCTYSLGLNAKADGTNVATITSNTADVKGATASAAYAFGDPTSVVGPASVTVTDSKAGTLGTISGDKTFKYSKTFTCDADEGTYNNTATIVETGASDSESVMVTCYALAVTKDAATLLTRTWDWTIDKTGDQTDLILSVGQQHVMNYKVVVDATSTDSDWAVSGKIYVKNPAPIPATINSVSDVISGVGNVTPNCGVTFPYVLAAGQTLECTYSSGLPDGADRVNTAAATLQNTPSGTTSFTGTANVSFANAVVTEVDECITVSDDKYGNLGTVCAGDAPKTFTYSLTVGPYNTCGDYTYVNTAAFHTNDLKLSESDSWTVNVDVPCATGCTLTQGYWKTHSEKGPAPYDDTWALLPNGANTPFFNSGKTWYQVFWTAPAGNAFYNLAHQYMAAELNILNGASQPPEVFSALAQAKAIFSGLPAGSTTLTKAQRTLALQLAATLDKYNNGLIGPGHCSE